MLGEIAPRARAAAKQISGTAGCGFGEITSLILVVIATPEPGDALLS
jgi:hypothetical protein